MPNQGIDAAASGDGDGDGDGDQPDASNGSQGGAVRVLTYNVAGLPQGVSGSDPLINTPLISPLLNTYDLVLAQEDFSYHDQLAASTEHPHQSSPASGSVLEFGDGLNRFSQSEFDAFSREAWRDCNGLIGDANDCLTAKGFSFARHQLAPGAVIDVYNLHMDAGRDSADAAARRSQVEQLLEAFDARSADRAIVIAGDFNMKEPDEADLVHLMTAAGLVDACRSNNCAEPERIDRVMARSSSSLELAFGDWEIDQTFVDEAGEALSDHDAVGTTLMWRVTP